MGKSLELCASASSGGSVVDWILGLLDELGSGPLGIRDNRQCPAHSDRAPSLAVGAGFDGRVLLHCRAGCGLEEILTSLRLSKTHLYRRPTLTPNQHIKTCHLVVNFPELAFGRARRRGPGRSTGYRLSAVHCYGQWQLLRYHDHRTATKVFEWEHRAPSGAWVPTLGGATLADLPLYEEQQVRFAVGSRERVIVVESESSVDALTRAGLYATTWAGGAASPQLRRLAAILGAATVLVVPDNDPVGIRCGEAVATTLRLTGATVSTLVPDKPGMDAHDLLDRDGLSAFTSR